jgi:hypothetical protein
MWQVKAEIKKSRVGVTAKVVEAINAAPMELKPKVLVSSTAVGYYGKRFRLKLSMMYMTCLMTESFKNPKPVWHQNPLCVPFGWL